MKYLALLVLLVGCFGEETVQPPVPTGYCVYADTVYYGQSSRLILSRAFSGADCLSLMDSHPQNTTWTPAPKFADSLKVG